MISESERLFIQDGVTQGLRNDGRGTLEYRPVFVRSNVVAQADGSCRVRCGDSEVLAGAKLDLTQPDSSRPNEGKFIVAVEFPAAVASSLNARAQEDLGEYYADLLERLCVNRSVLDVKKLCVLKGRFVFNVHIDIIVLSAGGSLVDALSMAIRTTLRDLRIPYVEVIRGQEEGEEDRVVVDERPDSAATLTGVEKIPLVITMGLVAGRFLIDLTREELACASSTVMAAVDVHGRCVGIQKRGSGAVDPSLLPSVLQTACRVGQKLGVTLEETLVKHGGFEEVESEEDIDMK